MTTKKNLEKNKMAKILNPIHLFKNRHNNRVY